MPAKPVLSALLAGLLAGPFPAASVAITEAEKEEARQRRDKVVPRLWQQAARGGTPGRLAQQMYRFVAETPQGEPRTLTSISKEDLARIRRILGDIHRLKKAPPAQALRGQLALTLEEGIELALQKNLRIQIAQLTRDSLAPEVARAEAIFHPVAGASLTASRERQVGFEKVDGRIFDGRRLSDVSTRKPTAFISQAVPTGATVVVSGDFTRTDTAGGTPPRDYNAKYSVSVVQPLLRGGRVYVATRPIRDAGYDLRIEEGRLRAEILAVTAQTKAAYYNVVLFERVIDAIEQAIARDDALIEASQALFRSGLVTKRDVYSAAIIRADDAGTLAAAKGDLELAQNTLTDFLGVPIGAPVTLRDERIDFEPVPLELERWLAAASARRPEILAAEQALDKSALNVRVAQNTLLPDLSVVASYGRGETGTTVGRALDFKGDIWTTGLVFSVPIGNVAARAGLARARIEHGRFEQELRQTKRRVELEVRAAVIKLRTSLEKMKALAMEVEQSEGKLEVAQGRFALGLATNLDVTDAQEKILKGETDLLSAIVDYGIGLAELEASIAGPI